MSKPCALVFGLLLTAVLMAAASTAWGQQLNACCPADGTACQALIPSDCAALPGTVIGVDTTVPVGDRCTTAQACCTTDPADPDGASLCQDLDPCACLAAGGISTQGTCAAGCCAKTDATFVPPAPIFANVAQLCAAFAGFPPPPNLKPPPNAVGETFPRDNETYITAVANFIRDRQYINLGWLHDTGWRLTGEIEGLPPAPHLPGDDPRGVSLGTHPAVRVYYSPNIIDGLCRSRCETATTTVCASDADCPGAGEKCLHRGRCIPSLTPASCSSNADCSAGDQCIFFPPGAMIVKEQHPLTSFSVDSADDKMWLDDACYHDQPASWDVMIRGNDPFGIGSDGSHDGWFWLSLDSTDFGNPPIIGSAAVTSADTLSDDQLLIDHCETRFPTGQQAMNPVGRCSISCGVCASDPDCTGGADVCVTRKDGIAVPQNYDFGRTACTNCHASAEAQSTFASLDNILVKEIRYDHLGNTVTPLACRADGYHDGIDPILGGTCTTGPDVGDPCLSDADCGGGVCTVLNYDYSVPETIADPIFLGQFPQISEVAYSTVLATRLPAETYDHIVTTQATTDDPTNDEQFLTSDQCAGCHDASVLTAGAVPNMITCDVPTDRATNLSPYAEWKASPLGLAGRDPIFLAQMEGERNLWPSIADDIQNQCVACHGAGGQRQLDIDSPGTLFTRAHLDAWPGKAATVQNLTDSKYGGLARDGVSCSVCHTMSATGLGTPATYTGQFSVGPADQVIGPYNTSVKTKPMENELGITPVHGAHIGDSAMCGSCHTINVQVLDTAGQTGLKCTVDTPGDPVTVCAGASVSDPCNTTGTCEEFFDFEQTTYLEWVNSDFTVGGSAEATCQSCHMKTDFGGSPLAFKVANIEDETLAATTNRLDDADITLPTRNQYGRHTLYGLNVFLNEMAQQFPVLLGLRQINDRNPDAVPALLTAREAVLEQARQETATVSVSAAQLAGTLLQADVTVANLAGHKFPSGTGARRAFIQFRVLDGGGGTLWASGDTDGLGVIVGAGGTQLASELHAASGQGCGQLTADNQCYQPHYETITSEDQVQIYEELVQNNGTSGSPGARRFTSSMLERWFDVKDNRLLPTGWVSTLAGNSEHTGPHGAATGDDDYPLDGTAAAGSDTVHYQVTLTPVQAAQVASVEATLYYQSTPPRYLKDRFDTATIGGAETTDTERLHHIAARLNVDVTAADGNPFIEDWKLEIANDSAAVAAATNTPTVASTDTPTETPTVNPTATPTVAGPLGSCNAGPLAGCRGPGKSRLRVADRNLTHRDRVTWNWLKGEATDFADFGDPVNGSTDYFLCVYDESSGVPNLVASLTAPAGGTCGPKPCWRQLGRPANPRGFAYADRTKSSDGFRRIVLRSGVAGKAKVKAAARGNDLVLPGAVGATYLNQDTDVIVQLQNSLGECWETTLAAPAKKNNDTFFRDDCGSLSGPACP